MTDVPLSTILRCYIYLGPPPPANEVKRESKVSCNLCFILTLINFGLSYDRRLFFSEV